MTLKPIKNKQTEFLKNMRESFEGTGVACEAVDINEELLKFYHDFKKIVHKHAQSLTDDDFSKYGSCFTDLSSFVNQAVGQIESEFYKWVEEKIELQQIDGQPVYFLPGDGVYWWPCPSLPFSLDLRLSHPADPPNW